MELCRSAPLFPQDRGFPEGDQALRGSGGPISVKRLDDFDDLANAYLETCSALQMPRVHDYNDGTYAGAAYLQYSTRRGFRCSTAVAYLRKARRRSNLDVLTEARAMRVAMDGKRATGAGVPARWRGENGPCAAGSDPVGGADAIASASRLSGIGQPELLKANGIDMVHALPSVGENLHDHPNTRVAFEMNRPLSINDVIRDPLLKVLEGVKFALFGGGMLSICSATAAVILKSGIHPSKADLKLQCHPLSGANRYARTPKDGLDRFSGFTIGITALQAQSRGLRPSALTRSDGRAAHRSQLSRRGVGRTNLAAGLKLARRMGATAPLSDLLVREVRPSADIVDDEDLKA